MSKGEGAGPRVVRKRGPEARTSARRLGHVQRRAEAVALRRTGLTYDAVGAAVGVTTGHAYRLVKEALSQVSRDTMESAEELLCLEAARLDALQEAIWRKAIAGNLGAVDRVLAIMARRAKLLGLDAPATVESGPVEVVVRRVEDWGGLG